TPCIALDGREIVVDHLRDEIGECHLAFPTELGARLRRISQKFVDLGWPEIARIDTNDITPRPRIESDFMDALPLPYDFPADAFEDALHKLPHGVHLAGRENIIVGLLLLQDEPHPFDKIPRVAPVPPGIEVAEIQPILHPPVD